MTAMINALLLKYKRGAAWLGASHRTEVVTLTYHHQQIIILGQHHCHHHHHRQHHQANHGKLRQDRGGWLMVRWEVVEVVKLSDPSPPCQHSQDREKCLCGFGLLTLMTSIL